MAVTKHVAPSASPRPPTPASAAGPKPAEAHVPTDDERRFVTDVLTAEAAGKLRLGVGGQLKCILLQGVKAKLIATPDDKAFVLELAKKHNITRAL